MRRESRQASNQLKRRLRAAAAPLADSVRAEALADGLEKAAAAVRVRQSYSNRGGSIRVIVLNSQAPYARWQGGNPRTHRHPLFGNREHWYGQAVAPFWNIGIGRGADRARREISNVLADISAEIGGR